MSYERHMEFGLQDGQRLLYLPGMDGTGRLFHRQTDLGKSYRVLCQSYPHDRKTTYEELAEEAASRLRQGGAKQPAVVVAESFGGAVGLTLALLRPEQVERLVLVNTFARYPRRLLIRTAALLGGLSGSKPSPAFTRPLRGWFFFAPDITPEERNEWWQRTADVPVRAFWRRACMIAKLDLRTSLPEIEIPTVVLAAPNDRLVPPRAGQELAKRLPHAELIEPRVGHAALIHPRVNLADVLDRPGKTDRDHSTNP